MDRQRRLRTTNESDRWSGPPAQTVATLSGPAVMRRSRVEARMRSEPTPWGPEDLAGLRIDAHPLSVATSRTGSTPGVSCVHPPASSPTATIPARWCQRSRPVRASYPTITVPRSGFGRSALKHPSRSATTTPSEAKVTRSDAGPSECGTIWCPVIPSTPTSTPRASRGFGTETGKATAERMRAAKRNRHGARIQASNHERERLGTAGGERPASVPRGTVSPRWLRLSACFTWNILDPPRALVEDGLSARRSLGRSMTDEFQRLTPATTPLREAASRRRGR